MKYFECELNYSMRKNRHIRTLSQSNIDMTTLIVTFHNFVPNKLPQF
jgi:hypothetical protein